MRIEVIAAAKAAVKFGSAVMAAVAALTLSRRFELIGCCPAAAGGAARFVAVGEFKPAKLVGGALGECRKRWGVGNKSWEVDCMEKGNFQGEAEESKEGWKLAKGK